MSQCCHCCQERWILRRIYVPRVAENFIYKPKVQVYSCFQNKDMYRSFLINSFDISFIGCSSWLRVSLFSHSLLHYGSLAPQSQTLQCSNSSLIFLLFLSLSFVFLLLLLLTTHCRTFVRFKMALDSGEDLLQMARQKTFCSIEVLRKKRMKERVFKGWKEEYYSSQCAENLPNWRKSKTVSGASFAVMKAANVSRQRISDKWRLMHRAPKAEGNQSLHQNLRYTILLLW